MMQPPLHRQYTILWYVYKENLHIFTLGFYCVLDMLYLLTLLPLLMSVGHAANSLTRAGILVFILKLCS